jgi:6-phosphogluconolactonase
MACDKMTADISGRIEVADDVHALSQQVAEWMVDTVAAASGIVRISLSGGSTPKELYTLLASDEFRGRMAWDRLEIFWGDERFVSHDSEASNYRMAREAMLSHVPVPPQQIHPMPVDGSPQDAAARYETLLKQKYGRDQLDRARPLFDIMLLGLGNDGHTASLIPGQPVLQEREHWVAAVTGGRAETRITLTYPSIESSRTIAFLAAGPEKTSAVKAVRAGDQNLPAARIRPHGDVIWFLDRAAAGQA